MHFINERYSGRTYDLKCICLYPLYNAYAFEAAIRDENGWAVDRGFSERRRA